MPILITSDLHFTSNPRDMYRHDVVDTILHFIDEYKVTTLIVLGDLTEKKDKHNAWLTNQIADHFNMIASCVKVIILQGNHDALDVDCPFFYFMTFLRGSKQIRWVKDPTEMRVDENWDCLFLPHTTDYKKRWSDVFRRSYKPDFIFAHNTFKGTVSESGLKLDGIPTSVFPKGSKVISGDIHKPQVVGPVEYAGAPYQIDFGDDYEPRMLLIEDTGEVKSIACPGVQKRLVHISDPLGKFKVENTVSPQDIVKVRIAVTPEQYTAWDSMCKEVRAWGDENDIIVHSIQPIVEQMAANKSGSRKKLERSVQSDQELVERYAKLQDYGARTVQIAEDIINKDK